MTAFFRQTGKIPTALYPSDKQSIIIIIKKVQIIIKKQKHYTKIEHLEHYKAMAMEGREGKQVLEQVNKKLPKK